ncbi:hypothetical protein I350_03641 [Cryptococcus amylolentus CBS 6273]|uniref:ubiquitinyl hydrolase 1 n=1 Tax=Cryptococcus amylolentus CBS 6273 TaxID=1296118 RepID=A0A1E3K486_9TREE|nr:hypothetical protein I350_03641 [Cryptococcus amylolentus CBS 6273]
MTQHPPDTPERSATLPSDLTPRSHPNGPRNPDHPGSSRTRYHTTPLPQQQGSPSQPISVLDSSESSPSLQPVDVGEPEPEAVYRPPEPVVDLTDEQPPPYSPGIVAEPVDAGPEMDIDNKRSVKDISDWQAGLDRYNLMDVDQPSLRSKPQLGPGVLPRRLLAIIHEHDLVRPYIDELPEPAKRIQEGLESPDVRIAMSEDVYNALPGGDQDHDHWYFCTTCWGWLRIIEGRDETFPQIPSMEEWEVWAVENKIYDEQEKFEAARKERQYQLDQLLLCREAGRTAGEPHEHFHEFRNIVPSSRLSRVERLDVEEHQNLFPHVTFGLERDEKLESFSVPHAPARLYVSDSSTSWIFVDEGMVPGQIPAGLVQAFTAEKMSNPAPGKTGYKSVSDAWDLLATLLSNALFKGKRGAVSLANQRVQNCIGQGILSSHVLYHSGFACTEDDDSLRVGPYRGREDDPVPPGQLGTMDRYMLRVWVEISLYLKAYQIRNSIEIGHHCAVEPVRLEFSLESYLPFQKYREARPSLPDALKNACHALGATRFDTVDTLELAYDLQIAFDEVNTPKYLGALETISEGPIYGKDSAQLKVAMEKSMDKFTENDLLRAYSLIGYTTDHAETICVAPHEAPNDYILDMHKKAIRACTSPSARQDVNDALAKIGKARESFMLQCMAEKGQTTVSVQEAYEALSAPRDAVDDGLIMQYEMAVNEYPGKADHYRICLSVIADAPGEERPGLKTFLQTGNRDPGAPARKDVPVGLQNIGNTCYLNSILQYLYSIKPLREAVLEFDQDGNKMATPVKPEVERARRFVRQLRLLFLQLYKSELPAVRPEEELAYLAITRPEVDSWVDSEEQPVQISVSASAETAKGEPTGSALDSIPSIPDLIDVPSSPTSTLFASAPGSPLKEPPLELAEPSTIQPDQSHKDDGGRSPETSSSRRSTSSSVLGKRAINERERSFSPGEERSRLKSAERSMSGIMDEEDKEDENVTPSKGKRGLVESPTMTAEMSHLELQTPAKGGGETETDEVEAMAVAEDERFAPPSVPPPSLPPRPPVAKKETLSSGLKFGLQQDSAEVLINILTQLEMALERPAEEGEEEPNLIKELYSCSFHQQTIYESALPTPGGSTAYEAAKDTEAVFTHPIIGVEEEGKDLDDCLAELYLKGADIEYEGKKGYMMELMDQFPPMLYIQMRRSQYDPILKRERKTNTHIHFPQTLSMSRYLVNAPAEKRAESIDLTREMVRIRTRLHALQNHQPLSIPDTFKHASSALRYLASADVTQEIPELEGVLEDDLFDHLDAERLEIDKEIEELQAALPDLKSRMNKIWAAKDGEAMDQGDEYEYELVSVYMHRGKTSGSGHYWTYQAHLPGHSEEFYSYNDELVTVVPATEVLQDRTGSDANPALLCYARKGWNLVETLHREVLEQEAGDVALEQDLLLNEVE